MAGRYVRVNKTWFAGQWTGTIANTNGFTVTGAVAIDEQNVIATGEARVHRLYGSLSLFMTDRVAGRSEDVLILGLKTKRVNETAAISHDLRDEGWWRYDYYHVHTDYLSLGASDDYARLYNFDYQFQGKRLDRDEALLWYAGVETVGATFGFGEVKVTMHYTALFG